MNINFYFIWIVEISHILSVTVHSSMFRAAANYKSSLIAGADVW